MTSKRILFCACALSMLLAAACSRTNNLLMGRIEANVGGHKVVVTDCYRTEVPAPETLAAGADGQPSYRFTPCRDAEILITTAALMVNGKAYGRLNPNDSVLVDHGVVSIQPGK